MYSPLWEITHQKPFGFVYSPLWKIAVFDGCLFRGGRLFRQIRYHEIYKRRRISDFFFKFQFNKFVCVGMITIRLVSTKFQTTMKGNKDAPFWNWHMRPQLRNQAWLFPHYITQSIPLEPILFPPAHSIQHPQSPYVFCIHSRVKYAT